LKNCADSESVTVKASSEDIAFAEVEKFYKSLAFTSSTMTVVKVGFASSSSSTNSGVKTYLSSSVEEVAL
jgi:hypothetical protein